MPQPPKAIPMSTAKLWPRVRKLGGRFYISKIGRRLWAATPYWMTPAEPFSQLLADFNLPMEPMCCTIGVSLRRNDSPAIDMSKIWKSGQDQASMQIQPAMVGGSQAFIQGGEDLTALFRGDGRTIAVNNRFLRFLQDVAFIDEWYASPNPVKPIVGRSNGHPAALLMPIRVETGTVSVTFDDVADEAAA